MDQKMSLMYKTIIKRLFDLSVSLIAFLILSPLLIPIMIRLHFTGEGYIFYLQERVGYNNKKFNIWKFATMLKESPNMPGGIITTKNDPRITQIGGFLRKSKINELPQIVNILKGDMSVVGPRPVMPKSFEQYPDDVKKIIYNVKPGLTGIGSIVFRDEETLITKVRNNGDDMWDFYVNKIYPFKGALELWYQSHASFYIDLMIILLTAWQIFFPYSDLVYRIFKDLPPKPAELKLKKANSSDFQPTDV